jgi:hypothetical protein
MPSPETRSMVVPDREAVSAGNSIMVPISISLVAAAGDCRAAHLH